VGVAIFAVFHTRIYNGLAGPFDIEARDLVAMTDVPAKEFVRVVRDGQPVEYSELRSASFYEEEIKPGSTHQTAWFGYIDESNRHMLVRIADSTNHEVIGVIDRPSGQIASHSPGALFLDSEKSTYRMWALLLALAGVVSIFVGLDQLRRAYATPKPQRPMRLFT
jgi:hypothetical protein